jgi:hypothetical protein
MSYSQEIYDAVRSSISGGNVGDVVRDVAWQQFDISFAREMVKDELCRAAYEMQRPSVLYRPTISLDGNCYCALYGEDLMSGCAGFGETMAEAMADFDKNWSQQKAPTMRKAVSA